MELLDKKLLKRFREVGEQIHTKTPLILARFFIPWNSWEWYVSEYHPSADVFYGYVVMDGVGEWCYFRLPEMIWWLKIEKDTQFNECLFW